MEFCLGTVQFGTQYGVQGNTRPDYPTVERMLRLAIDNGITLFDTAAAYGDAEEVLGRFATNNCAYGEKMCFVSKLDSAALKEGKTSDWGKIAVQNAEESLKRLAAERFYAYLFHNARLIYDADAVAALEQVQKANLAERIGVSIYTPEEAMKALEYQQISAIQIPYNLFDRRLDKAGFFAKASEHGVTVFARSSLLQGLAVMEPERLPEHMRFARPYLKRFRKVCEDNGISPLQAAIGYVGQHFGIDYVVFGVDNEAQMKEYLSLREMRLPDDMYAELADAFLQVEEKLVNPTLWK